jgi:hypothetical protein
MKIIKSVSFISLFFFAAIPACIKNTVTVEYSGSQKNPVVILSKPIVKRGEPLVVSTNAPDSHSLIKWAIRPSDSTLIVPYGNQATIYINLPGTYLITASFYSPTDTVRAYDSSNSTVTVNDSIYTPPVGSDYDSVLLRGDELTFTPVYSADSGFKIILKGTRLYNCYPYLTNYEAGAPVIDAINMNFNGALVVEGKGDCMGVKNLVVLNIPISPLTIGVHAVAVNYNDDKYEGLLNVTDSNFTFTWNYTSGIIISPLQIKKN